VFGAETFRKRWGMAAQWIDHYCIMDPRLLGGLQVEMASWSPLSSLRPEGVWELQADQADQRRFLWIASHHDDVTAAPAATAATAAAEEVPIIVPTLEVVGPLIAIATREPGPEQWALTSSDGVSLGRALIRTLSVSDQLRSSKANTQRLEVVWNSTFQKWEVKGIATTSVAVHSTKFAASK
jgi:hypothetical protein